MKQRHFFLITALLALPELAAAQTPPIPRVPPLPVEPQLAPPTPRAPRLRTPEEQAAREAMRTPRLPRLTPRSPRPQRIATPYAPRVYTPSPRAQMVEPPLPPAPPGVPLPRIAPEPLIPPEPVAPRRLESGIAPLPGYRGERTLITPQQQEWYQGDPADSLFRAAHAFFSRQEYRRAADRFSNLRGRYPSSRYFCDAAYYEAFARYRLGTQGDLRAAYTVLDGLGARCTNRRADVPELTARINSALARLGDAEAAARLQRAASQGQNVCDSEERNVKIEALNALAQMDAQAAAPVLRNVLSTTDECSAPIRRQAISLVARRNDTGAVAALSQIARSDASRENRIEALRVLGRMTTDAAYVALEEFFRTTNDERTQAEAAAAMASSGNPRALSAVRTLIERKDVAERVRISLISTLSSRQNVVAPDYWRTLYPKVESDELRQAVIYAIAKSSTDDSQQFLLGVARNENEPYTARYAAVSRIRATAPISELYRLLETADSRSMRQSIVTGLAGRKEPEATDRLIEIARKSTDPEVRQAAIRALSQGTRKDDPRVVNALRDILSSSCCR